MSMAEIKAATRAEAFKRRKMAHGARRKGEAARLTEVLGAWAGKILAGYMPMRTEIDCLPAMAAHDGPVAVPVIEAAGAPLLFRQWTPRAVMVPGAFGALIPEAGAWLVPEILVIPLLAFDRRGYRLGYGGGFYDRTLEGLRARGPVTAIGFAFGAQEVEAVPTESTDQPLDLIVTESDVITPRSHHP
ncbi:MAG: 5-formyltetrahydrofolate cyclo-ligase [Rhodobacteraceae bacterium]|nr:5-formyltetrahydrofolate cyclo-ligase [Paracoccaceae bacterium]MCP5342083.1 5-formyltetrahydrofolate cyclo-ligase [Paracoccaceae bacterium]